MNERQQIIELGDTISLDTRLNIVTAEKELLRKKLNENKRQVQNDMDQLKAVLEEVRLRVAETRKDLYDFNRECVVHAHKQNLNPHISKQPKGKVNAEKLKRHVQGKLKNKRVQVKKLHQKNRQTQVLLSKLEKQLLQKEEQDGEHLDSVDLEQLKIQNANTIKRYNQKIQI